MKQKMSPFHILHLSVEYEMCTELVIAFGLVSRVFAHLLNTLKFVFFLIETKFNTDSKEPCNKFLSNLRKFSEFSLEIMHGKMKLCW
jgi:hypothetical protein